RTAIAWIRSIVHSLPLLGFNFTSFDLAVRLVGFPFLITSLSLSGFCIYCFKLFGGLLLLRSLSHLCSEGLSIPNLAVPKFLYEGKSRFKKLGGEIQKRTFDVDIALALLSMASVVYERNNKAAEAIRRDDISLKNESERHIFNIVQDWNSENPNASLR